MLNNNLKKIFVVLLLCISLTFVLGCSSHKPSEDTMKKLIISINKNSSLASVKDFKEFKITESSNTKIGNEDFYCIKVNYRYVLHVKGFDYLIENKDKRYSFFKRGDEWQGNNGWPN